MATSKAERYVTAARARRCSERLRCCVFRPYHKGVGPTFTLITWDAGVRHERNYLGYRLTMHAPGKRSAVVFEGEDFGCSPLHAIDSDDAIRSLMGFLTLRPGDTDAEYFEGYTEAQREFCSAHAECLGYEVMSRFGED